ncbi:universal stress protein UspE [Psychromonas sp. Urea-02u-13]|uniref:universal stress protein UspE n=1 Tax=Psychromonas sp. Urea-02u-13 TaxID=2058326 RepID=UPI000C32751B|nr:universal stress protein UspE [Psychromonas sp. Urea-02u-13]PKG38711.1 universal stress protein UspE [Psychromonas sp. Urea-02u-13]
MLKYKNILVFIDPTQESQPALARATDIAKKQMGTTITLFLCCYDLSYEMTSLSSSDERKAMQRIVIKENQAWLDALAVPYQEQGVDINSRVIWHSRPFQAAIIEVLTNHHDLVVKATHPHSKLSAILFTPTDWNLLRKCPVPLLLVKHHQWPAQGNILCAIDCKSMQDSEHHQLNQQILDEAKAMASIVDANTHVVNAYPSPPMNIMLELPEFDPINYEDGLKKFHQKALTEYALKNNISQEQIHLEQGLPEDVISKIANEIDAQLVILGTVGRSGFSATLLGHTAEQVIDQLDCDLLALKPIGFKSPITL